MKRGKEKQYLYSQILFNDEKRNKRKKRNKQNLATFQHKFDHSPDPAAQ